MTESFFMEAFNALSHTELDEIPVELEEFVQSEDFLGLPPLSEYQYQIIRAGSQIYKYETLVSLYGEEKADKRWKQTCNELVLQLGKGSGKDYASTIACAYIVYLLLCLKDPSSYYGKPPRDAIDIINIAINADQAKNIFFKGFRSKIKRCPWFIGKYAERNNAIEFDKQVTVYSGHSEREAFEGLNLIVAILDEISGFALESTSGNEQAKTADAVYKMYRASVNSRFADFGKVILLSFPRFKDDYIQQRYDAVIAEKEVIIRRHVFKIDPDLADNIEGNEFEITWEEDHILRYRYPRLWALRRPTWEVNPTVRIDSPAMVRGFSEDLGDALGRFACMPSNLSDGYFKNKAAIDQAFVAANGVDRDGVFLERFKPKDNVNYYVHVDLAQKHDHCAVAMAHVEKWVQIKIGGQLTEAHPLVVVDAVRWWTPTKHKSVEFSDVRDYIIALRRRGFNLKLTTFDRWNSHDTMNILKNEHGIENDVLSVALKHYDDFLSVLYDGRLIGPKIELLIDELGQLKLIKNKVEHPRKGSKDLADAVCGAIFNAVAYTAKPVDYEVDVLTYKSSAAKQREEDQAKEKLNDGVIRAPKRDIPDDLKDYLSRALVL